MNSWILTFNLANTNVVQIDDNQLEISHHAPADGELISVLIWSPLKDLIKKWKVSLDNIISVATEREKYLSDPFQAERLTVFDRAASSDEFIFPCPPLKNEIGYEIAVAMHFVKL